jgi:ribosome biogenesis protein Tsr3
MQARPESFVAECYWPDVDDADLAELDRRIDREISALAADRPVRYLGSILLREDEVVLCQFEGTAETVRDVAERARIPFERILAAALAPWPHSNEGGTE